MCIYWNRNPFFEYIRIVKPILDKNWDIIQLHSDAFFPNYETYFTHFVSGSTAAYLISKKGIEKTLKSKIYSHADFIQHNFIKYNIRWQNK